MNFISGLLITAAFAPLLHAAEPKTDAKVWAVDPNHSSIAFRIDHLKFAPVQGLISGIEGTISLDDKKPEASTFELHVPVANLYTGVSKRDDHLKSPDFFNAKQFPNIELKSKSVKKKGDAWDVTADLTMHGVTKPVTFVFKRGQTGKDPWGGTRTGGETSFKIKRTDFGVSYMSKPGEVGHEVELSIGVEAVQK